MKNIRFWSITVLTLSLLSFIFKGSVIDAEEIVVSANGTDSTNTVENTNNTSLTVDQSNDADISNDINVSTDTGGNNANDNTGNTIDISTGDSNVSTTIDNVVNKNVFDSGCCNNYQPSNTTISNNGSSTNNNVSTNITNQTTITSNQNVNITNNIRGIANTGNNTARNNNGNVSITTGNIRVSENVRNIANNSYVTIANGNSSSRNYVINGNGSDSANEINASVSNFFTLFLNNDAGIDNNSEWDLTTGENFASRNNGNVKIDTGDIVYHAKIVNDVNKNVIAVTCCEEKEKDKPIPPSTNPAPSQTIGGKGNGDKPGESNPGNSQVLGASAGKILPITGINWFLFALLGNVIMLFMGAYLRLRAGRSPNAATPAI